MGKNNFCERRSKSKWSYFGSLLLWLTPSKTVETPYERIIYLTLYHPVLFLFIWSYWQTVFTDPLYPRSEYFLTREEINKVRPICEFQVLIIQMFNKIKKSVQDTGLQLVRSWPHWLIYTIYCAQHKIFRSLKIIDSTHTGRDWRFLSNFLS